MVRASTVARIVGPLVAVTLGLTLSAPVTVAEPAPAPASGGTFSSSFEAADPVAAPTPYSPAVNLTGKKYNPGSLMMHVDIGSMQGYTNANNNEIRENIADGSTNTKWLVNGAPPYWVTYPLTSAQTVRVYKISSANDANDRDPRSWTVAGSNDATCAATPTTSTWTTVDSRTDEEFDARYQTKTYTIAEANQAAYLCYRLDVTARRSTGNGMMQLSEWEILDGTNNVAPPSEMAIQVGNGPISGFNIKPVMGWTGSKALQYVGGHVADGDAHATSSLYAGLNVPVGTASELSYMLLPTMTDDLTYPSQYVAIDLEYIDPADATVPPVPHLLSQTPAVVDQYGFATDAASQGKAKRFWSDQWNRVSVDLSPIAGMTVTKVLFTYHNPNGSAATSFSGWFDDIAIGDYTPIDGSSLINYVDTRRGTLSSGSFSRGLNFPAAAVPNGFNFYSPTTQADNNTIYQYAANNDSNNHPLLQGFRLNHEPSIWMGDNTSFSVMPKLQTATNSAFSAALGTRALPFTHDNEIARPDLYQVTLDNGLVAKIAPGDHSAIYSYTFPDGTNFGGLLVDPTATSNSSFAINATTGVLTGYAQNGGTSAGRLFVYGEFSQPVAYQAAPTSRTSGRYANFDTSVNKTVELRLATSYISVAQATHNFELEVEGKSFDDVQAAAKAAWEDRLKVIDMSATTTNDIHRVMVYSDLYRLNLYPNARHENVGTNAAPVWRYASPVNATSGTVGTTQTNQQIRDGKMYVINGFWDTYRSAWPLYSMLYPEIANELVDGFAEQYRAGGWIARWSNPGYADLMTGTSSDSAFAEAYIAGALDPQTAIDCWFSAERNATVLPTSPFTGIGANAVGRKGQAQSPFYGYTPTGTDQSVSWGLEGLINDYAQAKMAEKMLADPAVLALLTPAQKEQVEETGLYLAKRSSNYINQFDKRNNLFAERNAAGNFATTPFVPTSWGGPYTETSGWNFSYHTPFDVEGLATLFGGRQELLDNLDAFFSTPETAGTSGIHEAKEARDVRMGQWSASNQVSFHIPWIYAEAGRPSSTQALTREATSRLYVGSDIGQGYPGDEDNGATSAWYLFGALGFYPLIQAESFYTIGSPFYDTIKIDRGAHGTITVNAPGNNMQKVYVDGVQFDGKAITEPRLPKADLLAPGDHVLNFDVTNTPTNWGAKNSAITTEPNPLVDLTKPAYGTLTTDDGTSTAALVDDTSSSRKTFTSNPVTLDFTSTVGVAQFAAYTITNGLAASVAPTDWTVEGSTDGTNWDLLDTRTGQTFMWGTQTRAYQLANPGAYNRLRITLDSPAAPTLSEIEFLADKSFVPSTVSFYPGPRAEVRWGEPASVRLGTVRAPSKDVTDFSATVDLRDGNGPRPATFATDELGGVGVLLDGVTIDAPGLYSALVTVNYTGPGVKDPSGTDTLYADFELLAKGSYALTGAFDAVCLTEVGTTGASCDGQSWGFARSQLGYGNTVPWSVGSTVTIPAEVGPGGGAGNLAISQQTLNAAGMRAWLPDVPIGQPDAVTVAGAKVTLDLGENATKVAFIGTSNEGPHGGDGKIVYADGYEQTARVAFADWCYSGSTPAVGTQTFSSVRTRINNSGAQESGDKTTSLFITDPITLETGHGKALHFVMPQYNNNASGSLVGGRVHIMAVATDGTGPLDVASLDPSSVPNTVPPITRPYQVVNLGTATGGRGPLSATINWGDNSSLEDGIITNGKVFGSHNYAPGTYTVTYTLFDGVTATVYTTPVTVTSANAVISTETGVVVPGSAVSYTGTGFASGESVVALLATNPVITKTITADASGDVAFDFTVPATTTAGTYLVTATGATSGNEGTSSLVVLPLKKNAVLTVSATPAAVLLGDPATLTATISTPITGQIEFLAGQYSLGLVAPDASGQAVLTTSAFGPGTIEITARYAGDTLTNPVTSAPVTITVSKPTYTPVLTVTPPTTVAHGSALAFTGTGFEPNEAVVVRVIGTDIRTVVTAGAGGSIAGSIPVTNALAPGVYALDAKGDFSETSVTAPFTVVKATYTPVVSAPASVAQGTALVVSGSGFEPRENVTIEVPGTALKLVMAAGLTGTISANLLIPDSLTPGGYSVRAVGEWSDTPATRPFNVVTRSFSTAITLPSGDKVAHGSSLAFSGTGFDPREAVTLRVLGSDVIQTVQAGSSGAITGSVLIPETVRLGTQTLYALGEYSNTAASVVFIVTTQSFTPVIPPTSASAPRPGDPFTVTATGFKPGEIVTLTLTGTGVTGTAQVDAFGAVSVTVTIPEDFEPGTYAYTLSGSYSIAVLAGSVNVVRKPVSISLLASPALVPDGGTLSLTALLTGSPSGSVVFLDGALEVGAAPIQTGAVTAASLDLTGLTPGIHLIKATYAGDLQNQSAQSATVSVTVAEPVVTPPTSPPPSSPPPTPVDPPLAPITLSGLAIPSTVQVGTPVTLLAVMSRPAAGAVVFTENGRVVAQTIAGLGPVSVATTAALAVGGHTLAAQYTSTDGQTVVASAPFTVQVTTIPQQRPVEQPEVTTVKSVKVTAKAFKQGTKPKVTVSVKMANNTRPVGKIAILKGNKTIKTVTLKAAKNGKVKIKLSKAYKKAIKVKAKFTPTNKAIKAKTSKAVKVKTKK